jgi:hypothetical protein
MITLILSKYPMGKFLSRNRIRIGLSMNDISNALTPYSELAISIESPLEPKEKIYILP